MFPVRLTLLLLVLTLFLPAALACGQSANPELSPVERVERVASDNMDQSSSPQPVAPRAAPTARPSIASPDFSEFLGSGGNGIPSRVEEAAATNGGSLSPAQATGSMPESSTDAFHAEANSSPQSVFPQGPATAAATAAPAWAPQASTGAAALAGPAGPQGGGSTAVPSLGQSPASHGVPVPTPFPRPTPGSAGYSRSQPGATTFQDNSRLPMVSAYEDNVSTFSLDTDRTSYRLALNWARQGYEVDPASVRAEEWINSFNYNYDPPAPDTGFGIYSDVFRHPLDSGKHMARLAFQAPVVRADTKPLNVTLVLDASGSMGDGNRIAIAQAAAESIRDSLRPQDRIAIVQFDDNVMEHLTVPHVRPDHSSVDRSLNRLQPNGATNVQAGLDLGVRLANQARWERPDSVNYIVLMSDGVANVDATNPFAILESAGGDDSQNPLRLITIGVGISNYNDYLLETLAQHGNGWYRYLDNVEQAQTTFSRENWRNLAIPFADQARAQITWNRNMVESWRIVGYENRVTADENFTQNRKEFAEIPSGTATTVFYELVLTDLATSPYQGDGFLGEIELRWVDPGSGATLGERATVLGDWEQDFDRVEDPYLRLGAIVGLTADRYSALPYGNSRFVNFLSMDLAALNEELQLLRRTLGHLDAFEDFSHLLNHIYQSVPSNMPTRIDSGYSP